MEQYQETDVALSIGDIKFDLWSHQMTETASGVLVGFWTVRIIKTPDMKRN
jgi:hypothetical protein